MLLANLTLSRISETVAGYANGSYVRESRAFDLANASFARESFSTATAIAVAGADYSIHGAHSFRGRNDGFDLARRLAERDPAANSSLAAWIASPPSSLDSHCSDDAVVSSLQGELTVTVRIEGGIPVQASAKGGGLDVEITYQLAPARIAVDFALPPSPVPVSWQTTGNTSLVETGDHRALDGHLILHAVDANGYAIQAVALNGSVASTRDESFLSYQDDGDGLWGPGDRVSWGGRADSLRLLDTWAGAFASRP